MRVDERAARMMRLLEYLNEHADRAVPIGELAALAVREFGVSEVTLRSDLAALGALLPVRKSARGTYRAGEGGPLEALLPGAPHGEAGPGGLLFATRLRRRAEGKIAIAGAVVRALRQQEDLRVLLLDAGTTTFFVADRLSEEAGLDLIVWTPSVAAAARLAGSRGLSVRLLGGEYQPEYAVVSGDETARALRALAGPEAEAVPLTAPLPAFAGVHCVLDVNSVSPEGRLFTDESKERLQKRLMAELAEELTLVADHTKLFRPRLGLQAHEVYALREFPGKRILRLVTDADADTEQRETARQLMERAMGDGPIAVTVEEAEGAVVFTARRDGA